MLTRMLAHPPSRFHYSSWDRGCVPQRVRHQKAWRGSIHEEGRGVVWSCCFHSFSFKGELGNFYATCWLNWYWLLLFISIVWRSSSWSTRHQSRGSSQTIPWELLQSSGQLCQGTNFFFIFLSFAFIEKIANISFWRTYLNWDVTSRILSLLTIHQRHIFSTPNMLSQLAVGSPMLMTMSF